MFAFLKKSTIVVLFVPFLFLQVVSIVTPAYAQPYTPTPAPIINLPDKPKPTVKPTSIPIDYNMDPDVLTEGKIGGKCLSNREFIDSQGVPLPETGNLAVDIMAGAFVGFMNTAWSSFAAITNHIMSTIIPPHNQACLEGMPSDPDWKVPLPDVIKGDIPSDPIDGANKNVCTCLPNENFNVSRLCIHIAKNEERVKCIECSYKGLGTWTTLGCLPNNFSSFLTNVVFNIGMGIAGMVALLGIIYSAIVFQTSQGNPEKIEMARESMTSFIVGLLLIIFSVFILRFLGLNVLQIVFGNL